MELLALLLPVVLGAYAIALGLRLLDRTIESDPSKRWGCGRLAFAWFGWLLVCLLAVGLFLPCISTARPAARRAQCTNHLKQIVLAMHNYHDKCGSFPPAYTVDKNGRPLHSWRVLLLPFMEQKELYDRIRLNEPYDSPHNRRVFEPAKSDDQALGSIPYGLLCPEDRENRSDTNYVMLVGPHTISGGPNCVRLKDITDGDSNTIAVVEIYGLGIGWYEPRDLRVDQMSFRINDPDHYSIASRHPPGGAQVAFVDGHIQYLPDTIDPRVVEALTTINGGEDVNALLNRH